MNFQPKTRKYRVSFRNKTRDSERPRDHNVRTRNLRNPLVNLGQLFIRPRAALGCGLPFGCQIMPLDSTWLSLHCPEKFKLFRPEETSVSQVSKNLTKTVAKLLFSTSQMSYSPHETIPDFSVGNGNKTFTTLPLAQPDIRQSFTKSNLIGAMGVSQLFKVAKHPHKSSWEGGHNLLMDSAGDNRGPTITPSCFSLTPLTGALGCSDLQLSLGTTDNFTPKSWQKALRSNVLFAPEKYDKLRFGSCGFYFGKTGTVSVKFLETFRLIVARKLKKTGRFWIRLCADTPVTARSAETRMGRGKGAISHYEAKVRPGQIFMEFSGVPLEQLQIVYKELCKKTPVPLHFVF